MNNAKFSIGFMLGIGVTVLIEVFDVTRMLKGITLLRMNPLTIVNTQQVASTSRGDLYVNASGLKLCDSYEDVLYHEGNDALAKKLHRTVRVACWVLTSPKNLHVKAIHVQKTWTKRCNLVVFISSETNSSFPTVGVNASEGREHLTAKTMQAFKYLYDHHLNDADWFLKADDDTYVIMENLRYFLSDEDPRKPVYFGQRFKPSLKQGFASGGAGYVISKEALIRYGQKGSQNSFMCKNDSGGEDVEFGRCLEYLGVILKPSLDVKNRTRFHCYTPEIYLRASFRKEFIEYDFENAKGGIENISDYAISFHYISPTRMYDLEYYIYHLRPYGILNIPQKLNVVT